MEAGGARIRWARPGVAQEPLDPGDPLWSDPRVVATPHVAGVTEVSYRNMAKLLAGASF